MNLEPTFYRFAPLVLVLFALGFLVAVLALGGCNVLSLRPIQRNHAMRIAAVQQMLATDAAHLNVAVPDTEQMCNVLDERVTGLTAGSVAAGVLASGSGISSIFTDSTPKYIVAGTGVGLSMTSAVLVYLSTSFAQTYSRRCAVNVGGSP